MSVINQLKEKRNHLIAQATLLVKPEMNAETRAQIDAIYADADALKGDIDRAERALELEAELRSTVAPPATSLAGDTASAEKEVRNKQYKVVLDKYLRKGAHSLTNDESRALQMGKAETRDLLGASGSNAAFLIETDLQKEIEIALKMFGGMRAVARSWKTSQGNPFTWPMNNDVTNPGYRIGAVVAPATVNELDLTFTQQVFGSYTYTTGKVAVANELLQDASFDLEAFIKEAFVTRIGRIQNTEFTLGTGVSQPTGAAVAAVTGITAATGGSTTVTYNNLVDTVHALDPLYRMNAKFMFHDTTLAALRKLTDNYGRPLLGLGINGGDPDSVLGYKYQINQDMPVLAPSNKSILFGDFSKYIIRDSGELRIIRLEEIAALSNETVFAGFSRADAHLLNAGTNPLVAFVNSAT